MARTSHHIAFLLLAIFAVLVWQGCGPEPGPQPNLSADEQLERAIDAHGIEPIAEPPAQDPARVELGRALFFDRELSGNRDTSCASCHHPREMTGDDIPLSVGTGARIDGEVRHLGEGREFTARNSSDVFNRGVSDWTSMFWDKRVRLGRDGQMITPAGSRLPDGLDNLLAAQAMFPVAERDEMRGEPWDQDIFGEPNELGEIVDGLFNKIWAKLIDRLLAFDGYEELFAEAYPGVAPDDLTFVHAANALAAFQIAEFSFTESAWDRYVAGEEDALDEQQKRGGALFFGEAGCADCHGGTLFTDQKAYNLAVPQFGPGAYPDEPYDRGFGRVSNNPAYDFAFRTPTLRNVALTPPYMHNGAFETLEQTIRHHLAAADGLRDYDAGHLPDEVRELLLDDPDARARILETLDPWAKDAPELSDAQIDDLVAFMEALTSEGADDCEDVVPESVPSGLPVD
ncbi:MAG: cytochrome-c peroxidase [Persicimonas sp.]